MREHFVHPWWSPRRSTTLSVEAGGGTCDGNGAPGPQQASSTGRREPNRRPGSNTQSRVNSRTRRPRSGGRPRPAGAAPTTVSEAEHDLIAEPEEVTPETIAAQAALDEARATFAQLDLDPRLLQAVTDAGYEYPTSIQSEAIPLALRGSDIIGLAQTGTGKTAAFTLPLINRLLDGPNRTRALVLTPTRELALQVEESVRSEEHTSELQSQ